MFSISQNCCLLLNIHPMHYPDAVNVMQKTLVNWLCWTWSILYSSRNSIDFVLNPYLQTANIQKCVAKSISFLALFLYQNVHLDLHMKYCVKIWWKTTSNIWKLWRSKYKGYGNLNERKREREKVFWKSKILGVRKCCKRALQFHSLI